MRPSAAPRTVVIGTALTITTWLTAPLLSVFTSTTPSTPESTYLLIMASIGDGGVFGAGGLAAEAPAPAWPLGGSFAPLYAAFRVAAPPGDDSPEDDFKTGSTALARSS